MPNVRKRIEVLERSILPIQYLPTDDFSIDEALSLLSDEDLGNLIGAGEANNAGLQLTGPQRAAQRAFARVVAQARFPECAA